MPIQYRGIPAFLHLKKILATSILYWHLPVTLRLVFSLGVGMKGYLYTVLASSSNPDVSIFFRCRNEGISNNTNLRVTEGCKYSIEVYLHSYSKRKY
jgi:hypothetical protein